jgi:DNA-binding transcriptional LysR family regulator
MATSKEHRVPKKSTRTAVEYFDWESARAFVEIARHGSLRSAAKDLHLSVNALRRRLTKLERSLGAPLFTRHIDGIRLTADGDRVLVAARHMEVAALGLAREYRRDETGLTGDVKLATTEGLSTLWIVPHLAEYQQRQDQRINLHASMAPADILRLEADMSIQLNRPSAKDLKVVKLGRMHTMPFTSSSYIEKFGKPSSMADLLNHRLVLQVAEQVTPFDEFLAVAGNAHLAGRTVLRTNASSVHYSAVLNGLGIGMLPTYCYALGAPFVPLDLNYHLPHDIWLAYHSDVARVARVREVIDWLVEIFSSRKYPWFSDHFIHPRDLPIMSGALALFEPLDCRKGRA